MPVLWFDEVPGGWTYFKEMALRLANVGLKIIVVSPRAKGNKRREEVGDVTVYRCSSIYFLQIPLLLVNPIDFLSTLKGIIQKEKHIDLIYDATSGALPLSLLANLLFKLKGMRIPLVIHVHGELKDLKSKGLLSLTFELYLHMIARFCFAIADKILLAGEKIAPRILGLGAHPNKLKIVRLGLKYEDRLQRHPNTLSKEEKMKLKTSVGLRQEDFVVGYVGRLSPGKGLDILLNAVAIDKNAISALKVLLVGDGGEKERLKALASKLGISDITIFLGHRENVPNLLQLMDVFVDLSVSEAGISASQLEAMSFALPSIITPFTDIANNMRDAIVVPFKNPQAVAYAILLLYQNEALRSKISANAYMKAQELLNRYTWNGYVDKVLKVFKHVTTANTRKHTYTCACASKPKAVK